MSRRPGIICVFLALLAATLCIPAAADTIDFEQYTSSGSNWFTGVPYSFTVGPATFSGGQLMINYPYVFDPSTGQRYWGTVYGTEPEIGGYSRAITITFAEPVSDFSVLIINGKDLGTIFQAVDNWGNTASLPVSSLGSGGYVSLPFDGITQVSIAPEQGAQDQTFFIDNISFTPASQANPVPEPSSGFLLASGTWLCWRRLSRRNRANRTTSNA